MKMKKLNENYFKQDVLFLAPDLIGKTLVCVSKEGNVMRSMITETEAYKGIEDKACHAHKGKTKRNKIMWAQGGHVYIYLIYGMYYMFNIVTGMEGDPQAVLVRSITNTNGPGRLTRLLQIDKSHHGEFLPTSSRIWIEDSPTLPSLAQPRIGIDYAGEYWKNIEWRFTSLPENSTKNNNKIDTSC